MLRFHPKNFVNWRSRAFPFPATAGQVEWTDSHTLVLRDVKFGDFFFADSIVIRLASATDPAPRRYRHISDADVFMSKFDQTLSKEGQGDRKARLDHPPPHHQPRTGHARLGPQLPPVPVNVGARRPVILNHIHFGTPDQSLPMTEERVVELENIHFSSPFDPLAPVLSLPLVRIKFSYSELWHHHIRSIDSSGRISFSGRTCSGSPTKSKRSAATEPRAGPESPWKSGISASNTDAFRSTRSASRG